MTHDQLLTYLDSDANPFGLDAISTHGFLTALVIGPPLPNWQHALFDDEYATVDEEVKLALQRWQVALSEALQQEAPLYLPFVDWVNNKDDVSDASTGSVDTTDTDIDDAIGAWCVGFVDAMYASDDNDWFADVDNSEDVAMLTLPMLVFSGVDDPELETLRQDSDTLEQMANAIQSNVTELFLLFHMPNE